MSRSRRRKVVGRIPENPDLSCLLPLLLPLLRRRRPPSLLQLPFPPPLLLSLGYLQLCFHLLPDPSFPTFLPPLSVCSRLVLSVCLSVSLSRRHVETETVAAQCVSAVVAASRRRRPLPLFFCLCLGLACETRASDGGRACLLLPAPASTAAACDLFDTQQKAEERAQGRSVARASEREKERPTAHNQW